MLINLYRRYVTFTPLMISAAEIAALRVTLRQLHHVLSFTYGAGRCCGDAASACGARSRRLRRDLECRAVHLRGSLARVAKADGVTSRAATAAACSAALPTVSSGAAGSGAVTTPSAELPCLPIGALSTVATRACDKRACIERDGRLVAQQGEA
jgi:hypothetical protein